MYLLYPQKYRFRNNLVRPPQGTELIFDRYGVAYTPGIISETEAALLAHQGFTILLSLGRPEVAQSGYSIIAQVHSGDDGSQLLIGHWSDYVIAMNGEDYRNTQGRPNLTAKLPQTNGVVVSIIVSSSAEGSQTYLNSELGNRNEATVLEIPSLPLPRSHRARKFGPRNPELARIDPRICVVRPSVGCRRAPSCISIVCRQRSRLDPLQDGVLYREHGHKRFFQSARVLCTLSAGDRGGCRTGLSRLAIRASI